MLTNSQIDTSFLSDDRLSWKAKGLLMYFLSHPDKWHLSVAGLMSKSTDGHTAIRSGLDELVDCGYLINKPVKNDQGRIMYWKKDFLDHSILDAKEA